MLPCRTKVQVHLATALALDHFRLPSVGEQCRTSRTPRADGRHPRDPARRRWCARTTPRCAGCRDLQCLPHHVPNVRPLRCSLPVRDAPHASIALRRGPPRCSEARLTPSARNIVGWPLREQRGREVEEGRAAFHHHTLPWRRFIARHCSMVSRDPPRLECCMKPPRVAPRSPTPRQRCRSDTRLPVAAAAKPHAHRHRGSAK